MAEPVDLEIATHEEGAQSGDQPSRAHGDVGGGSQSVPEAEILNAVALMDQDDQHEGEEEPDRDQASMQDNFGEHTDSEEDAVTRSSPNVADKVLMQILVTRNTCEASGVRSWISIDCRGGVRHWNSIDCRNCVSLDFE